MASERRRQIEALVRRYFEICSTEDAAHKRDLDAVGALATEDFIYELPFMKPPVHAQGRDTVLKMMSGIQGRFKEPQFIVQSLYVDEDRSAGIARVSSSRKILKTGELLEMDYIYIIEMRGDRMSALREYVNPLDAQRMVAMLSA